MISLRFDDVLDKLLLLVVLACAALTFADYFRTLVQIVAKRKNDAGLGAQSGPSLIARPAAAGFVSGAHGVRKYSYKGTALRVVLMTEIGGVAVIVFSVLAAVAFVILAFRSDWAPTIDLIRCGLIVDLAAGWLIGAGLINTFPTVWIGEKDIVISVYFTRRAAIPWSEVVNVKRWPLLPDSYMVSAKRITPIHQLYGWLGRTSLPSFVIHRSIESADQLLRELGRKTAPSYKELSWQGASTFMSTDPTLLVKSVAKLYEWCRVIDQNLAFILQELPSLSLPREFRREVSAVCTDFQEAMHDVIDEMRILEDKLGVHPGEPPYDPNVANSDPRVTLELIENWLSKEAVELNSLVRKLWGLQQQDPNTYTLVNALVTESAANILNAVAGVREESRNISKRLSPPERV